MFLFLGSKKFTRGSGWGNVSLYSCSNIRKKQEYVDLELILWLNEVLPHGFGHRNVGKLTT
jgi:hypothetical protein